MHSWSGRLALTIALLTATIHGQAPADLAGLTFNAHVIGIVDGDTLDVLKANTKRTVRIRLDGIDTPERGEPFTQQARNLTRVLAFDQDVIVIGKELDRYGRLVARVRFGQVDLSVEIVAAGLACHFLRYSSDPVLARAEADARSAGRGFWAPGVPKPACIAASAGTPRSAVSAVAGTTSSTFFGNVNSRLYHASTCRNAHCKNCTREFHSRAEAEAAGFRAAGDCLK
jgi:endonuclease YncB( thermonuclease family)